MSDFGTSYLRKGLKVEVQLSTLQRVFRWLFRRKPKPIAIVVTDIDRESGTITVTAGRDELYRDSWDDWPGAR